MQIPVAWVLDERRQRTSMTWRVWYRSSIVMFSAHVSCLELISCLPSPAQTSHVVMLKCSGNLPSIVLLKSSSTALRMCY